MARIVERNGAHCYIAMMINARRKALKWSLNTLALASDISHVTAARIVKDGNANCSSVDRMIYAMGGIFDEKTGSIVWDDYMVVTPPGVTVKSK